MAETGSVTEVAEPAGNWFTGVKLTPPSVLRKNPTPELAPVPCLVKMKTRLPSAATSGSKWPVLPGTALVMKLCPPSVLRANLIPPEESAQPTPRSPIVAATECSLAMLASFDTLMSFPKFRAQVNP
jgi:hypothetical protein